MDIIVQNNIELLQKQTLIKQSLLKIKDNANILKDTIIDFSIQNYKFNIFPCFKQYKIIQKNLDILSNQEKEISTTIYDFYSYTNNIEKKINFYREIFISINEFFNERIALNYNFINIKEKISKIKNIFIDVEGILEKFDLDKTISLISELKKEVLSFFNMVHQIFILIKIKNFSSENIEYVNQTIKNNHNQIDNLDYENLIKLILTIKKQYNSFCYELNNFNLKEGYNLSIYLIKDIEQLNNFIYINMNSPYLISNATKIINYELNNALEYKDIFSKQINFLKQFFIYDQTLTNLANIININFENIIKECDYLNNLSSKSYLEKKNHLKNISSVIKNILLYKKNILNSVDDINNKLKFIVYILSQINNFELSLNQIKVFCKLILLNPIEAETEELKFISELDIILLDKLNFNLNKIRTEIIQNNKISNEEIELQLEDIAMQFRSLITRATNSYIVYQYAKRLMMYANKYIKDNESESEMKSIQLLFQQKKYFTVLDFLIKFIKEKK